MDEENPASFATSDWIEALLQEYEDEAKSEARWPTLLLEATGRKLLWSLCGILGVNTKGVPGSACRLLERYLSHHIRSFLQETRDTEQWERYKDLLASRFYLLMVSCIQLAAKMSDLLAPLSASTMRTTLLREGIVHTKAEIIDMEFHVYSTLDFRIPLWTTLEVAEFLATQVDLGESSMIEAIGLVMNLSEFHRDQLAYRMRCWTETCNTSGSSSPSASSSSSIVVGSKKASLHSLHMSAGAVSAAARYMHAGDPAERLAALTRTSLAYVKAISDTILNHIIPEKKYIPVLKRRRLR